MSLEQVSTVYFTLNITVLFAEFGSLTASQLMEKVRGLQNLAFQLGLDEGKLFKTLLKQTQLETAHSVDDCENVKPQIPENINALTRASFLRSASAIALLKIVPGVHFVARLSNLIG